MTIRIVKLLATTIALGAIMFLSTDLAGAKFGASGGWHGGHSAGIGGARVHGFSGARMSGLRAGNFSSARWSGLHPGKFSGVRMNGLRAASLNGKWASHSRFANVNGKHLHALGATRALGNHAAWNKWGNHHWHGAWNGRWAGWGGWFGPVFWPFFYGDLFAFVFWPWGYFDPFWAYGDIFVWDAIFWPGPSYASNFYDDYGYRGPTRRLASRDVARETTGSIPSRDDLAQNCGGLAPGVTDLPMDRIDKAIELTDDQLRVLGTLKAATLQASNILKASCSSEVSLTPLGRLETVQKRLDGMIQALGIVRTPLDNFYNSLNEEQKQRFAALGPASFKRTNGRGSASGDNLAELCSRRAESFTQLPLQRIEQVVKPVQQQQDAFEKLKAASTEAANQLQTSCPAQMPRTALDRFDAVGKRLDAMASAVKLIHPALSSFYSSLTDEQKARFNILAPVQATTNRHG